MQRDKSREIFVFFPMRFLIWILMFLATIAPFVLIFFDYHKKENRHKAVFFVACFLGLVVLFRFILIPIFSFYIMLLIPVAVIIYLLISRSK